MYVKYQIRGFEYIKVILQFTTDLFPLKSVYIIYLYLRHHLPLWEHPQWGGHGRVVSVSLVQALHLSTFQPPLALSLSL